MASDAKLREQIAAIADRPRATRLEEVERILRRLGAAGPIKTKHGVMYKIGMKRLMLNEHNNGKTHLPKYCVDSFTDLMTELGLYDGSS